MKVTAKREISLQAVIFCQREIHPELRPFDRTVGTEQHRNVADESETVNAPIPTLANNEIEISPQISETQ